MSAKKWVKFDLSLFQYIQLAAKNLKYKYRNFILSSLVLKQSLDVLRCDNYTEHERYAMSYWFASFRTLNNERIFQIPVTLFLIKSRSFQFSGFLINYVTLIYFSLIYVSRPSRVRTNLSQNIHFVKMVLSLYLNLFSVFSAIKYR